MFSIERFERDAKELFDNHYKISKAFNNFMTDTDEKFINNYGDFDDPLDDFSEDFDDSYDIPF